MSLLLYGGNANFYHLPLGRVRRGAVDAGAAGGPDTLVVPSAGPTYGAAARPGADHPAARVPDGDGAAAARHHDERRRGQRHPRVRRRRRACRRSSTSRTTATSSPRRSPRSTSDGLVSAIKYAVVRNDTADDPYLRKLVDAGRHVARSSAASASSRPSCTCATSGSAASRAGACAWRRGCRRRCWAR